MSGLNEGGLDHRSILLLWIKYGLQVFHLTDEHAIRTSINSEKKIFIEFCPLPMGTSALQYVVDGTCVCALFLFMQSIRSQHAHATLVHPLIGRTLSRTEFKRYLQINSQHCFTWNNRCARIAPCHARGANHHCRHHRIKANFVETNDSVDV